MLSGEPQIPQSQKSSSDSSFLPQSQPDDNFHPLKMFGSRNEPQVSP